MEWIFIIVIIGIIFFTYNGFATRCPSCGKYTLHPKDKEATRKQWERYKTRKKIGMDERYEAFDVFKKPGYTTENFKCKSCGHHFNRKTALLWLHSANKLGEESALRSYNKMIDERDNND